MPAVTRCRSCSEEISFVKLSTGKFMPVEGPEAEIYYLHHNQPGPPQMVLITDEGVIVRGRLGQAHESGVLRVEGRESHFARCPGADEHRRP